MAYVNNWLHCVWGTKNKTPFLTEVILEKVLKHIRTNASQKNIYIDSLNGYKNHIHCLLSLPADQTLARTIQLLKGESSYWINKSKLTSLKFEWAVEYYGASISESHLPMVRKYIRNQQDHHKKRSWEEEYNEFISDYTIGKSNEQTG